jgi:transcriptional regulator with XRE-family HTH domain
MARPPKPQSTLFSEWIRETRTALRMSQAECARQAGMKAQQWHYLETRTNRPHLETVHLVARVLQVPESTARQAAGYPVRPEEIEDISGDRVVQLHRLTAMLKELDETALREVVEYVEFKLHRRVGN